MTAQLTLFSDAETLPAADARLQAILDENPDLEHGWERPPNGTLIRNEPAPHTAPWFNSPAIQRMLAGMGYAKDLSR